MRAGMLLDIDSGAVIVGHVERTTTPWERMRGLLGRTPLADDAGLWLVPCNSVHTAFMAYPIDVVFLDRALVVLQIVRALAPWRSALRVRAHSTLELKPGGAVACELAVGQGLRWQAAA